MIQRSFGESFKNGKYFSVSALSRVLSFSMFSMVSAVSTSALAAHVTDEGTVILNTSHDHNEKKLAEIEVFTVSHQRHHLAENEQFAQGNTTEVDLSHWLSSVPGANVNSNGPVTGIAQYRGLYGDRVSTTLNGHTMIGAGPNAMDTPLSYSTPLIIEEMKVYRGIAPVSAGMNTLGGAIDVSMRQAESSGAQSWENTGDMQIGYRSNNQAKTLSAVVNSAKGNVAVLGYGNVQSGDDFSAGDDISVSPTAYNKKQFGSDVRYANTAGEIGVSYHYTDTQDSGTPALPMDIESIFAHRFNVDSTIEFSDWQLTGRLGYLDAKHEMNNFEMRTKADMTKYRRNTTDATTVDYMLSAKALVAGGELTVGIDGYSADHNAIITNPNSDAFEVVNFNNIIDERYAIFSQWKQQFNETQLQVGIRIKEAKLSADDVETSMAMMSEPVKALRDNFNAKNRDVEETNVDLALSAQHQLTPHFSLYAGLGLKNRAPSYQELYLWTPMEATSGLADGHTYMGDTNLTSETAYQSDVGVNYQSDVAVASAHIFYQRIDNYIQGTPLGMDDMSAKMVATMMSGDTNPLKFTNVDAQLYGFDINGRYKLTKKISVSGLLNYVEGERRDINDFLYRVAPLNGQLAINYITNSLQANIALVSAAGKTNVSETNGEQTTSGYTIVNIGSVYAVNEDCSLRAGIDNLFDKKYQNHLGGYNRVTNNNVPHMSRLPSEGISGWVELSYSF